MLCGREFSLGAIASGRRKIPVVVEGPTLGCVRPDRLIRVWKPEDHDAATTIDTERLSVLNAPAKRGPRSAATEGTRRVLRQQLRLRQPTHSFRSADAGRIAQ